MPVVRHTISLSKSNNDYAVEKAKKLFDEVLSKYINYLINKDREREQYKLEAINRRR